MININKHNFVTAGSLADDYISDPIQTQGATEVNFDIMIPSTGTPAGVLYILASGNVAGTYGKVYLDANKVYGQVDASDYDHAGGKGITIAGSGLTALHIPIVGGIAKAFKIFFDRTSGTGSIAIGYVLKGD